MLELFIGSIFLSNITLVKYLGIRKDSKKTLYITYLTALITVLSSIANYYIYELLLSLNAIYLKNIVFIFTITIISGIVLSIYKLITSNDEDILPMIVSNSLILGVNLIIIHNGYSLIDAVVYSLGCSIGYVLIMNLICYLNVELDKRKISKAFRGYPITLITLGILYMIISKL